VPREKPLTQAFKKTKKQPDVRGAPGRRLGTAKKSQKPRTKTGLKTMVRRKNSGNETRGRESSAGKHQPGRETLGGGGIGEKAAKYATLQGKNWQPQRSTCLSSLWVVKRPGPDSEGLRQKPAPWGEKMFRWLAEKNETQKGGAPKKREFEAPENLAGSSGGGPRFLGPEKNAREMTKIRGPGSSDIQTWTEPGRFDA